MIDSIGGQAEYGKESNINPTLRAANTGAVAFSAEKPPVYCLQGNGIDRADTAGCNGKGWREDESYTLNTVDRPAVAYAAGLNRSQVSPTLIARMHSTVGTTQDNLIVSDPERYIVRRLTPTECARLQGFPDRWGDIEPKERLTDEDLSFWKDVRNTHAAINGRAVRDYTEKQMLNWYNKLHTDSAEYKMWGNGIALPPALYCMQGMHDALMEEELTHGKQTANRYAGARHAERRTAPSHQPTI